MLKKILFKTNYDDDEIDSNLNRSNFIQERIKMVEKFIPELGKALFDYTYKMAKSRDCIDKIALILNDYAKAEDVTSTFKLQITDFANLLLDVGTKCDAQVHVMENNVLGQLGEFDKLCSHVQNELKMSVAASDKERNWMKQLKRVKSAQPQDQEQITLAEEEFLKARGESARSSKNLDEQIRIFEKKRLNAMKETLLAWTLVELHFHSKALEFFTNAYQIAADIDISAGIEEFRSKLRSTEDIPRSNSSQRSDSMLHLISLPFRRKTKFTGSGIPHPSSTQTSSRSSQRTNIPSPACIAHIAKKDVAALCELKAGKKNPARAEQ